MKGYKPPALPNIPAMDFGIQPWARPPGSFTFQELRDQNHCGITSARKLLIRIDKMGRLSWVVHKGKKYYTVKEQA